MYVSHYVVRLPAKTNGKTAFVDIPTVPPICCLCRHPRHPSTPDSPAYDGGDCCECTCEVKYETHRSPRGTKGERVPARQPSISPRCFSFSLPCLSTRKTNFSLVVHVYRLRCEGRIPPNLRVKCLLCDCCGGHTLGTRHRLV